MFFIYSFFMIVLSVLFLPIILIAFIIKPKLRAGFPEKIGIYNIELDRSKPTILVHAVSVGEVNAVENLVKKMRETKTDWNIVLSTVTKTGHDIAFRKLEKFTDKIVYFPYDFPFSVKAFLNALKPKKVLIAETEIWPNFSNIANKMEISLVIVNGRISPSSYNGYKKLKFFFKSVLSKYELILMQTKEDLDRITAIGAPSEKVEVMGNLKFDIAQTLNSEEINKLNNQVELKENPLIVAASTHSGEDEIVLSVYERLLDMNSNVKLLLVPRHPERYSQVEDLIKASGMNYGKRTENATFAENNVILLDTMGELAKFYSISKFAFIGGSFSGTGGHNPLEANIWNKPVISGPSVFNFKDIYRILTATNAATIVNTTDEFLYQAKKMLIDNMYYEQSCSDCAEIFKNNTGAIERVIEKI